MLRTIELCAGGGGLSIGLERSGFQPIALIDNDPHACATLRVNRPRWNTIEADLRHLDLSQWRGVDLVSGGLPCPPYSLAGKQEGSDDQRDLFPAMLDTVAALRPRAVLIENVRGLLHAKFATVREHVNEVLAGQGFRTHWAMLNAADFGTPQVRSRVFLIGLREGDTSGIEWPFPVMRAALTVGDTLRDLMASRVGTQLGGSA